MVEGRLREVPRMELLLLLLLLIPLAWLLLLGRLAKGLKKHRFAGLGALILAVAVGWIGIQVTARPPTPPVDYTASEDDLRAILLEPESAPRYSFRD
jgi:hypothetical protein